MGISSISSSSFFAGLPPTSSAASPAAFAPTEGAGMSRPGQFLSRLQSLEQSDPAKAKQLLSDLATKLRSEASQPGASPRKAALADTLQKAADSGDLTDLLKSSQERPGAQWSRGAAAYGSMTRASW